MRGRKPFLKKPTMDRSGEKFGTWTALFVSGVKRVKNIVNNKITTIWMYSCKCDCGNINDVSIKDLMSGKSKNCMDCRDLNLKNHNWTGTKDIPRRVFSNIKKNADKRSMVFEITIDDIQKQWNNQKGLCYFTGQPLKFFPTKNREKDNILSTQASLDRIDSTIGYTAENVVWTTKTINRSKSYFNKEDFVKMCEMVYKHSIRSTL